VFLPFVVSAVAAEERGKKKYKKRV